VRHRALVTALLMRQLELRYRIRARLRLDLSEWAPATAAYALVFRFMRIACRTTRCSCSPGCCRGPGSPRTKEGTNSIVSGSALVTKSLFPPRFCPRSWCSRHGELPASIVVLLAGWLYGVTPSPLSWLFLVVVALQCGSRWGSCWRS
jgi:hypothetical protein